ncbi:hypothetical protein ZYGR_0AV01300 [Zygosaccharomyces rouxii]|uniref:Macro domain-containing protein n=1 Tax=Zygosaccharomyces rouxii TaxID=4956 RepID=A0A1Q3AIE2_ZYGRO|nr:hypothetical protein ZYGR_0AV01300 [Zygosaccharomyces rouxii]
MRVILCDTNEAVCRSWFRFLGGNIRRPSDTGLQFHIHHGSLESLLKGERSTNCAVVSPGNSFGYLGGGFDLAIRDYLGGEKFESWFRRQIGPGYHHVGSSTVVDLGVNSGDGSQIWNNKGIRYVIHVPTMVAPSKSLYDPSFPLRTGYEPVFNATWNSLASSMPLNVDTLIIPGLCSGWFGVPVEVTCKSMCFALRLYAMKNQISVDLQNALIMYFLNYPFKPFISSSCKKECRELNINMSQLQKFDAERDSIESIIPDI